MATPDEIMQAGTALEIVRNLSKSVAMPVLLEIDGQYNVVKAGEEAEILGTNMSMAQAIIEVSARYISKKLAKQIKGTAVG